MGMVTMTKKLWMHEGENDKDNEDHNDDDGEDHNDEQDGEPLDA